MAALRFSGSASNARFPPMDRYVVIGNPVSHSLSPAIHALFAKQTGDAIDYSALEVPLGEFALHAQRFFDKGGAGANVTLPFKVDAFRWAGARTRRAEVAEAANFLARRDGRIEADNTDGAGLVADLTANWRVDLRGIAILILGAGGAVRDRKSTRLNSSHIQKSRMPSSA